MDCPAGSGPTAGLVIVKLTRTNDTAEPPGRKMFQVTCRGLASHLAAAAASSSGRVRPWKWVLSTITEDERRTDLVAIMASRTR